MSLNLGSKIITPRLLEEDVLLWLVLSCMCKLMHVCMIDDMVVVDYVLCEN